MKWFYVTALAIAALMVLSPYLLLRGEQSGRQSGKVVSYDVYGAKVKSIDPATCGDTTSASIQGNIYEGLYTYHFLKRPVEVVPQLAEEMPRISPDGRTYTIKIKKGVNYSRNACFGTEADGRPKTREVRAADFVLAFKRVADFHVTTQLSLAFIEDRIVGLSEYRNNTRRYAKGDLSRYDKEDLRGVRALDEHTLQIELNEPFPQLVYVLAIGVYAPIPREVAAYYLARGPMESRSPEILQREAIAGTGPYLLTDWIKGGKIVLERNDEFRHETYPAEGAPGDEAAGLLKDAGKQVPFIDVQELVFVEESNPAWMMFERKQRDLAGIPRDVYDKVISPTRELVAKYEKEGVRLLKYTSPAVYWIVFNMDDPVVGKSKSLRQALCLAYDVETHIEVLYNGRGIRATNIIPSEFKGHDEAGPGPYYRYDLDAAKEKIEQAKQELLAVGVIKPGEPIPALKLDMAGRDESSRRFAEFAMGEFRKLGVELKVEMNDWPTLQSKVQNKQCQLYTMGWHADYPDAENFLQLFYTPNIDRGTNNSNYSNAAFDELFRKAATELDESKRVAMYVEMVRMLNEDCPVLLLSEPVSFLLIHKWVSNVKPHPIGYGYLKYRRIDVDLRRRMGGR